MDRGILVAGEPDESHHAVAFGFQKRFGGAIGPDEQVRVVLETDAVHLPEVEMIGAEAAE